MSRYGTADPCRIDSDSDGEQDARVTRNSKISRPKTAQSSIQILTPKFADWDVRIEDETQFDETVNKGNSSRNKPKRLPSSASSASSDQDVPIATTNSSPTVPRRESEESPRDSELSCKLFEMIKEDRTNFVFQPIDQNYSDFFQCRLQRDTSGVQGNFYPTFYLQAERPTDSKKEFILAARRIPRVNRTAEYIISTNIETLSKGERGEGYVGKLRGNNVKSTEYTLYSAGLSPKKHSYIKTDAERERLRREVAGIFYSSNFLGFKGPRQINLLLPKTSRVFQPTADEPTISNQWRDRRFNDFIQLRNKTPSYNEATKTYVIHFSGNRVVRPSVKNFQIVVETDDNQQEIVMQFGRIDSDVFTCDFRYPISPIQAFGIALSSFDSAITRE